MGSTDDDKSLSSLSESENEEVVKDNPKKGKSTKKKPIQKKAKESGSKTSTLKKTKKNVSDKDSDDDVKPDVSKGDNLSVKEPITKASTSKKGTSDKDSVKKETKSDEKESKPNETKGDMVKGKVKVEKKMYDRIENVNLLDYLDEYKGILSEPAKDVKKFLFAEEKKSYSKQDIKKILTKIWEFVNAFAKAGFCTDDSNQSNTLNKVENLKNLNIELFKSNPKFVTKNCKTSKQNYKEIEELSIFVYEDVNDDSLQGRTLNMWSILSIFMAVLKKTTDKDYDQMVKYLKVSDGLSYIANVYKTYIHSVSGGDDFSTLFSLIKIKKETPPKPKKSKKPKTTNNKEENPSVNDEEENE